MAETFGVAASAVAVAELAAKLALRYTQYLKNVSKARDDINRLHQEVFNLSIVATRVQHLLVGPRGPALATTAALRSSLEDIHTQLVQMQAKLKPSILKKTMRRFGFRALKWLFNSKDAEKVV
jgi:tryptophan synthase beta subunit